MPGLLGLVLREWRVIRDAPLSALAMTAVVVAVVWAVFSWRYGAIIEGKNNVIDQKEAQIEFLQSKLASQPESPSTEPRVDKRRALELISTSMEEGRKIQEELASDSNPPPGSLDDEYKEWNDRVERMLREEIDPAYAVRFRSAPRSTDMGVGVNFNDGWIWQAIEGKTAALNSFLPEIQRSP